MNEVDWAAATLPISCLSMMIVLIFLANILHYIEQPKRRV